MNHHLFSNALVKRSIKSFGAKLNKKFLGCLSRYIKQSLRNYKLTLGMQHEMEIEKNVWDPLNIFDTSDDYAYAVIILNRPIRLKHSLMLPLWEKAQVTITVDGGTSRWLNYLNEERIDVFNGDNSKYIPNFITGDMDSCSPYILHKLKSIGSKIIVTPDQMYTDYTKALMQLDIYTKAEGINLDGIYVIVEASGRFDHIIGNINTLYKAKNIMHDVQIIQIASESLVWLLEPGFHKIKIPDELLQENNWCGLLPIGTPAKHISTTGLKWNLNDGPMEFGGLVSTSNTYNKCPEVTVDTDVSLIWTMGVEVLMNGVTDVKNSSI